MQAKTSLAAPRRAFDERAKTTLILLAGLAAGCGQKGPLTLPGAARRPGRLALTYYIFRGSSLDVRFVWSRNAGTRFIRVSTANSPLSTRRS